jgi:thiol-disulfide isomerase/thioredoxin
MRALLVAVAALLFAAGCSTGTDAVVTGSQYEFVAPAGQTRITYDDADRKPIAGLSGPDLMNEGRDLSLADFAGDVVVVNVWGQWCPPCRTEAAEMETLHDELGESGVRVLGLDVRETSRQAPQDFVRDRQLTYPSIYDESGRTLLAFKGYPPNVVPSTIVLDRAHRVAAVYLEPVLADDLRPLLTELAAETA